MAREMIGKLANILRALLRDRDAFVPFRGGAGVHGRLPVDIEVSALWPQAAGGEGYRGGDAGQVVVPSMLLQPLIENSD